MSRDEVSDRTWVISCRRRRYRQRFRTHGTTDQRASMRRSRCDARSLYGQHCKTLGWSVACTLPRRRRRRAFASLHPQGRSPTLAGRGDDCADVWHVHGPRRSRITVSDWSARWLATKVDLKATTRRGYDGILRVHVLTRRGAVKLADITHEQIARWIA